MKYVYRSGNDGQQKIMSCSCAIKCDPDEAVTQQHFRDEVNINTIVGRFIKTGVVPTTFKTPLAGDFVEVDDFHSAMTKVTEAQERFMELPAALRRRFNHDPQELIRFLESDKNRDEAIKLGLVQRPPEKTRDVVQAVDELAAKLVPRQTP